MEIVGSSIKGVYRENADEHIRTLNMWVEQHARQQAATLTDKFVETTVAKDILHVARLVRENQTMGLVVGPTGIGKTRCAQAVHETIVGSIYVMVICGVTHAKGLTGALAGTLGVRGIRKAQTEFQQRRIVHHLNPVLAFRHAESTKHVIGAHQLC